MVSTYQHLPASCSYHNIFASSCLFLCIRSIVCCFHHHHHNPKPINNLIDRSSSPTVSVPRKPSSPPGNRTWKPALALPSSLFAWHTCTHTHHSYITLSVSLHLYPIHASHSLTNNNIIIKSSPIQPSHLTSSFGHTHHPKVGRKSSVSSLPSQVIIHLIFPLIPTFPPPPPSCLTSFSLPFPRSPPHSNSDSDN